MQLKLRELQLQQKLTKWIFIFLFQLQQFHALQLQQKIIKRIFCFNCNISMHCSCNRYESLISEISVSIAIVTNTTQIVHNFKFWQAASGSSGTQHPQWQPVLLRFESPHILLSFFLLIFFLSWNFGFFWII